jgi:hypothetical protein
MGMTVGWHAAFVTLWAILASAAFIGGHTLIGIIFAVVLLLRTGLAIWDLEDSDASDL